MILDRFEFQESIPGLDLYFATIGDVNNYILAWPNRMKLSEIQSMELSETQNLNTHYSAIVELSGLDEVHLKLLTPKTHSILNQKPTYINKGVLWYQVNVRELETTLNFLVETIQNLC